MKCPEKENVQRHSFTIARAWEEEYMMSDCYGCEASFGVENILMLDSGDHCTTLHYTK